MGYTAPDGIYRHEEQDVADPGDGFSSLLNLVADSIAPAVDGLVSEAIADDPTVAAAAAAAVDAAAASARLTAAGSETAELAYLQWTEHKTADTFPASFPADDHFPQPETVTIRRSWGVPILDDSGTIAPAVIPPTIATTAMVIEQGEQLRAEFTAEATKPSWAPVGYFDTARSAWNLTPRHLNRLRAAIAVGDATIAMVGDSILYLGGEHADPTAYTIAAHLRADLTIRHHLPDGGPGLVLMSDQLTSGGQRDQRVTINAGTGTITLPADGGAFGLSVRRITGETAWIGYTSRPGDVSDTVIMTGRNTAARTRIVIDGTSYEVGKDAADTTAQIVPESGYPAGMRVARITGLTLAAHTVQVYGAATGSVDITSIEERRENGLRIHNIARSGASTLSWNAGLPWAIDEARPHCTIFELGINNWQGRVPLQSWTDHATATVNLARTYGDVIFLLPPQPDYTRYPIQPPTYPLTDHYANVYQLAQTLDVPVIDIAHRWTDYATSAPLSMDGIHPNVTGNADIATLIATNLATFI